MLVSFAYTYGRNGLSMKNNKEKENTKAAINATGVANQIPYGQPQGL